MRLSRPSSGDHVFLSEMLLLPRGFTHFEGDIKKKGRGRKGRRCGDWVVGGHARWPHAGQGAGASQDVAAPFSVMPSVPAAPGKAAVPRVVL